MANKFIDELNWRGLIYQKTPAIEAVFERGTTLYLGIDPTGDNLHVGHLLGILVLKRALQYRNRIILLAGGGTSLIGDPSGKDEERPILSKEMIEKNKEAIKKQMSRFFEFDGNKARMVDNADWLENVKLIEFLREVGKYIPINTMLDKESVTARISRQEGISYAEFSYQLLQAYDFLKLFEDQSCEVQIGGSDQWGNIVQGVELIRRKIGRQAYSLSFPLIVNPKTGKKFGKTEKGVAIWLNPDKTHPFNFYQFFVNVEDELAPILIKYFSFKNRDEIAGLIEKWEAQKETRSIQKELAYEMTSMIHGQAVADQAKKVAAILFERGEEPLTKESIDFVKKALPYKTILSEEELNLEQTLVDLRLVSSKSEARRLIQQNGVKTEKLFGKYILIKKGRKDYGVVEVAHG